jgi:catechol 2,3-dioxygenase-like lactoylglutathione lyase family enzyme
VSAARAGVRYLADSLTSNPRRSMQSLPRNFRLTAVAAFATIIIAVSAFTPGKNAALSPRFNHVMLFVSNLDSSITFYTTAFDLQVAQRITELSVTSGSGAPAARPVKMALLKFPGQEFVLELAERAAPASAGAAPYYFSDPDSQHLEWNCCQEHVLPRTQWRAGRADADRLW